MTDPQPASVYDLDHAEQIESLATFAILVDNEPGVLHRLVGLFAARGYNIESLTVAETDRNAHTSRVTIVTRGECGACGQEGGGQDLAASDHRDLRWEPEPSPRRTPGKALRLSLARPQGPQPPSPQPSG